jgi:hypothetical protein
MVKEKTKEHGLEYVILNDDESQPWEIDYDTGHAAANVSEYVQLDLLKHDSIVKYSGKIEDFLSEQRGCKNILHETMDVQPRMHMKSCSFETHR